MNYIDDAISNGHQLIYGVEIAVPDGYTFRDIFPDQATPLTVVGCRIYMTAPFRLGDSPTTSTGQGNEHD